MSGILYPLRRKAPLDPRCQIDFANTMSLVSPSDVPLLDLVEEIWIDDCYTRHDFKLRKGAAIIDIGANIGTFTVRMAAANPKARVIAVEPDPENAKFLFRNIANNRLKNVSVIIAACGKAKGERTLYARGPGMLHSLFCRDMQGSDFIPNCQVRMVSLQDLFVSFGMEWCDFLKLDCEGAEYEILLNTSPEMLSRISRIALEYHVGFNSHSPLDLERFLLAVGFQVERLPMREDGTGFLYATNTNAPVRR